jgi:hypothetical protein
MLRSALLLVVVVAMSFALTALAGYLVDEYENFAGPPEATLSLVIRFAISPTIAIRIGILVGRLSKNHPVSVTVLGLTPWTIMLLASPHKPTSIWGWISWVSPVVICLPLATAAGWRTRRYCGRKHAEVRSLA